MCQLVWFIYSIWVVNCRIENGINHQRCLPNGMYYWMNKMIPIPCGWNYAIFRTSLKQLSVFVWGKNAMKLKRFFSRKLTSSNSLLAVVELTPTNTTENAAWNIILMASLLWSIIMLLLNRSIIFSKIIRMTWVGILEKDDIDLLKMSLF